MFNKLYILLTSLIHKIFISAVHDIDIWIYIVATEQIDIF